MNVLIVGGGGREHALAWKVSQNPEVKHIYVAPGNAGTAREFKTENVDISATDVGGLKQFAEEQKIDLTIVGPEASLAAGIVNTFQEAGLRCFGPTKEMAQLESSKSFAKDFLRRHHIPTADYASFTNAEAAHNYVDKHSLPLVIKADGLAAGKGVVIASTASEAHAAIDSMLTELRFGKASQQIVIEEFLEGEEVSFIVMVDGKHVLPLATSQDHKRRDDNDEGPNTGGMGAYSPAPIVTDSLFKRIMETVIDPTVKGMQAEGHPYTGFLYAGLMITADGEPKVLEYNCRLGDPETQPLLFRLESDLVSLCSDAIDKKLDQAKAIWDKRPALGVVMAAEGYPDAPRILDIIYGLDIPDTDDCKVFHAGTQLAGNDVETHGGRVLCVTAKGDTLEDAQKRAYQRVSEIHWSGSFYRNDIGARGIVKE